jgi:hypothetical protein
LLCDGKDDFDCKRLRIKLPFRSVFVSLLAVRHGGRFTVAGSESVGEDRELSRALSQRHGRLLAAVEVVAR